MGLNVDEPFIRNIFRNGKDNYASHVIIIEEEGNK
jgi:hypothetical protein